MRQTRSGPELGQRIGTYHAVGLAGALAQFAVRTITLLVVVLIVLLVWIRPNSALLKGSVAAAVVLVLFGLRLMWRFVTARCGGNRCRLHRGYRRHRPARWSAGRGGVAGGDRSAPDEQRLLLMAFHRVEVERRGAPPLTFTALGLEPAVIGVLLRLAARNGLE